MEVGAGIQPPSTPCPPVRLAAAAAPTGSLAVLQEEVTTVPAPMFTPTTADYTMVLNTRLSAAAAALDYTSGSSTLAAWV